MPEYDMAQPSPAPQPGPPVPTPVKTSNGIAIAGFVLGLLGFLGSFIPVINLGGIVLGVVGAVLAAVGLAKSKKLGTGKGLATAGLVLGSLALIIGIIVNVAFANSVDDANDKVKAAVEATKEPVDETASADTADEPTADVDGSPDSDFAVAIGKSRKVKDYDGNAALLVNYTFTNNSDEDANFSFSISDKAFQGGVQLERAILLDDDKYDYDSSNSLKDVKPGSEIKVQEVYVLADKSDVTIELSELISFDDEILASTTISLS